ncbi:hypothetical protein UQ64_25905 [Paenibacillus etheri]|uniref:Uncharacterized protein n=1 Tax=Paenibacillus etheri TaxID=1306852 RepID=A0A0W1ASV3_9BACL|nr:hypothetical protein UQ64_25905 [Paenibacillus etheri]
MVAGNISAQQHSSGKCRHSSDFHVRLPLNRSILINIQLLGMSGIYLEQSRGITAINGIQKTRIKCGFERKVSRT